MRTEGQQKKRAKQIFQYLSLLLPVLCLIVLLVMIRRNEFRFLSFNRFSRDAVKGIIDRLSFVSTLGISLLCAFFLSVCYYYSLNRKKSKHLFLTILVLDVVINCWLLLPITGVNKTSARQMQSILDKSRKGFPIPSVTNPPARPPLTDEEIKLIGNWDWYNKEIVIAHKMDYPSNLKSTEKFFSSADTALLKNKPFIFFKSGINQQLSVTSFSPHSVTLSVQVSKPDTLVLLQNKFPGWKAWVDNQPAPIFSFAHTFLAVAVPENTRTVRFCFSPLP